MPKPRSCTVYYESSAHTIPLPADSPDDCHVFLKEQLAALGMDSIRNKEILVGYT